MAKGERTILELPVIDDITDLWVLGSKQGNTPGEVFSVRCLVAALIPKGFFQYQEETIIFIVQTRADLPTTASPVPLPPAEGDTALYMSDDKTIVYKTTYTNDAWSDGVDVNAVAGYLWTESVSDNGYYFIPGQNWNQLDASVASAIANDSSVTGATVKDALETLFNKGDEFRKWKTLNNHLIAGKGATGTADGAIFLVNNPQSQPKADSISIGNRSVAGLRSIVIKTDNDANNAGADNTGQNVIAMGHSTRYHHLKPEFSIFMGTNVFPAYNGVGDTGNLIIIGREITHSTVEHNVVAIGRNIGLTYNNGQLVVIGGSDSMRNLPNNLYNAIILGYNSTASGNDTMSIGSASIKRRITNVAAGTANNDAVTVAQMNAAIAAAFADYVNLSETSHLLPAAGGTFTLSIASNAHWSIVDLPAWATANITSGGTQKVNTLTNVNITVAANDTGSPRNSFFTVVTDSAAANGVFQILQDIA
ncbi:hypothetical protein IR083_20965 [Dysgonomonas sp. GY75]|uniref:hypothetical protein n=1 Tax=Dysgonomonas sp. GY75 TaxID=2780419 RepID=UPI001883A730|nr:hypothetical protein [Dysgonomonas sp. GY75]MBF0651294.1 hypothetical protein [Dysgonomonas sp. GY75]